MSSAVVCGECGEELVESPSVPEEQRRPCAKCGSTKRKYTLVAEPGVFRLTGYPAVLRFTPAPASLLLQAVVTLGEKTDDGRIIEAVAPAWFEIAKMIEADPSVMYQIDDRKWEELIAGWYEQRGYTVTLTPQSGDFGRDVIAELPGVLSIRIIDQVKAYAANRRVSANDVRALLGVLQADHKASKGLVTTTADFAPGVYTEPGIIQYLPTRLALVNGEELQRRLAEVANRSPG
jgi:restriction system protein